ncbi:unnamed protein product [Linum trigynum]|uniref:Uncharacterized protein n=1 Tax=Linum trigynum TaxID=586398 RepID=A0AAV2FI45_9ROSI
MMEEGGREDLEVTIMAMKGSSREWNRVVASNLARFLKCPLIDTHDINQALQKSSSSSQTNNNNEMAEESPALDVAYGVASTQLISLKIPVIISGAHPLTLGTTWRALAASSGARLIVIKCHPPEDKAGQHQSDGEDEHDGILLVHVDAESFDGKKAEGIVSKIHLLLRQQKKYNNNTKVVAGPGGNKKAKQRKQRRSDHLHEWVEKQPNNSSNENTTDDGWSCIACGDGDFYDHLTAYYRCTDCDFALHKSCAEKPADGLVDRCPPYLEVVRPQSYDFPSKVKCKNCRVDGGEEEEFSGAVDDCHDCLMQTNLHHQILPTVLREDTAHDHRLNLVIMPFGYEYKYLCARCDKLGYSVGYKCYECNDLPNYHVACALLAHDERRVVEKQMHRFFRRKQKDIEDLLDRKQASKGQSGMKNNTYLNEND